MQPPDKISEVSQEAILTLQELRKRIEKLVKTAYSSKVFSYEVFIEDLVSALLNQQNDIQIVYLKIQNIKEEFNLRGKEWCIGHTLGNVGIEVIAELLEEYLTEKLSRLNMWLTVYNEGPDFFLIIKGQGEKEDICRILNEMFKSGSSFKEKVISKIKINLKEILLEPDYQRIKNEIDGLTQEIFNMYGGISERSSFFSQKGRSSISKAKVSLSETINKADELIRQAFQAAKSQQIEFSLNQDVEERLREAKRKRQSGILAYNEKIGEKIENHKESSLLYKNEYQSFYPGPSQIYKSDKTYEGLFREYDEVIHKEDLRGIAKIKEKIFNKAIHYISPHYKRNDPVIRKGNRYFKVLINGVIQFMPQIIKLNKNFQIVFKVGGDEAGVLIWRAKEKKLWIVRIDVNNLNATNTQLGTEVGNKILDEIMRLSSEDIPEKIPFNVKDFFINMKDRIFIYSRDVTNPLKPKFRFKRMKKIPDIEAVYPIEEERMLTDWQLNQGVKNINLVVQGDSGGTTVITASIKKNEEGNILLDDGTGVYLAPFKLEEQEINKEFTVRLGGNKEVVLKIVKDTGRRKSIERLNGAGERRKSARFGLMVHQLLISLEDYERLSFEGKLAKRGQGLAVKLITGPMVAVGGVEIDADLICGTERDISVIQGRAACAAEEAKKNLKLYQALNDGQFDLALAYKEAVPLKKEDVLTFKDYKISPVEKELMNQKPLNLHNFSIFS